MNQPPVETKVPEAEGGLAALLPMVWSLLGESGFPFLYRDVRELFMWLLGCE